MIIIRPLLVTWSCRSRNFRHHELDRPLFTDNCNVSSRLAAIFYLSKFLTSATVYFPVVQLRNGLQVYVTLGYIPLFRHIVDGGLPSARSGYSKAANSTPCPRRLPLLGNALDMPSEKDWKRPLRSWERACGTKCPFPLI